jgi:hypothetical protein
MRRNPSHNLMKKGARGFALYSKYGEEKEEEVRRG